MAANTEMYQYFPSIAVSSLNNISVSWIESSDSNPDNSDDPTTGDIFYAFNPGNEWSEQIQLTNNNVSLYPSIRWGGSHNSESLDIVWSEAFAGNFRIKHLHCDDVAVPTQENTKFFRQVNSYTSVQNMDTCGPFPESLVELYLPLILSN